ncbi:metallophosphoesterase, partial [Streptomyces cinereospinus]
MLVALVGAVVVVALLVAVHWYVWRRLVRDVTVRWGVARWAGTVAVIVLPVLAIGAFVSVQVGLPFWLQRTLAWPGYLWLALLLYVVLALAVGEAVRPLLLRALARRAAAGPAPASPARPTSAAVPALTGAAGSSAAPTGSPAAE